MNRQNINVQTVGSSPMVSVIMKMTNRKGSKKRRATWKEWKIDYEIKNTQR